MLIIIHFLFVEIADTTNYCRIALDPINFSYRIYLIILLISHDGPKAEHQEVCITSPIHENQSYSREYWIPTQPKYYSINIYQIEMKMHIPSNHMSLIMISWMHSSRFARLMVIIQTNRMTNTHKSNFS